MISWKMFCVTMDVKYGEENWNTDTLSADEQETYNYLYTRDLNRALYGE
jgi:hypothetical protein